MTLIKTTSFTRQVETIELSLCNTEPYDGDHPLCMAKIRQWFAERGYDAQVWRDGYGALRIRRAGTERWGDRMSLGYGGIVEWDGLSMRILDQW